MRHLLMFGLFGLFIAGVGERVAKRIDAKAPASAGQSAAAASAGSREALGRPSPRPSATQTGPNKLAVRADRDGHFRVAAMVNGRHMNFMVDTGATVIALTRRDADRLGIKAPGRMALISTANGSVTASTVRLDAVEIGDISVTGVEAVIMPDGRLSENLLGMSYLSRLGRFEIRNGVLMLEP